MNYARKIATFESLIGMDDMEVNVHSSRCVFRFRCKTEGAESALCISDTFLTDLHTTLSDIGNGIVNTGADKEDER